MKLNLGKCYFGAQQIVFLGHVVIRQGSYLDPKKVQVVKDFPIPKFVINVWAFLGLTGYYKNFVRVYAKIVVPLFDLTKKDQSFLWTLAHQEVFDTLKFRLIEAPILVRPNFEKPFIFDVDWSIKRIRSILSQKQDKHECVIAYASKGLIPSQRKFHPMEGECYALIWGIMHFLQYLYQASFVFKTDHMPLEWFATISDPFGRWISMLEDFNFKIVHRARAKHANADVLSRNPVGSHDEDEDFGVEIQDEKNNVDVAHVWNSTTLSPHILIIS